MHTYKLYTRKEKKKKSLSRSKEEGAVCQHIIYKDLYYFVICLSAGWLLQ